MPLRPTNEFLRVQFFYRDNRRRQPFVRRTAGRADIGQKDTLPAAKRQIVGEPMEAKRAQATQMNVMPHDPLDGEQRELPVGLRSDKRAPGLIGMRQRPAVDPARHALQPAPLGIVVDGQSNPHLPCATRRKLRTKKNMSREKEPFCVLAL